MSILIEIFSLILILSGIMFLIRAKMYHQKKTKPLCAFVLGLALFILTTFLF